MIVAARPVQSTIAAQLRYIATTTPRAPAIFYAGRVTSYAELYEQSVAAAKALLASGVKRGDRVGVLMGNQPEWLTMCFGSALIGAVLAPMNTWYKETELLWALRHSGARVLVASSTFLKQDYAGLFARLIPELADSKPGELKSPLVPELQTIAFLAEAPRGAFAWPRFLARGDEISSHDFASAAAAVLPTDPAFILYTSGSTADPKGVLLAQAHAVANGYDMGQRRFVNAEDRVWIGTPLFYALGAINALQVALAHGAAIVLQDYFEAGRTIEVVQATGATVYYGTGNMTRAILDHPSYEQRKIGSLQKGNAGTYADYKRMTLVEMGIRLASAAYGLTESYGNATVSHADDPLEAKINTNGTPLPGTELMIVDPVSREPLTQGETGLILLRGHVTPGYFQNPEETAKAIGADGFFDTGDLGWLDSDGRLIFHSRLKEVIKTGGINVSPLELEQLLARHPAIAEAFVVGAPDKIRGEVIVAYVQTRGPVSEAEVKSFVSSQAASFKTPHRVFFRTEEQLPRLASGKVAKHVLAKEAAEAIR